jgi:RNA polymerase sigma factor (TIGR02999 family)
MVWPPFPWNAQVKGKGATAIDSTHVSFYALAWPPKNDPMPGPFPQDAPAPEVTVLLRAWADGDEAAGDRLFPILYSELRRQAGRFMRRERHRDTLQPSGLVHEAYLRLAAASGLDLQDRTHFFAIAARVMRQVLVDHARRRKAAKRDGCRVTLGDADAIVDPPEVLDLENALKELAALDPRQARVVELRFFGGLEVEEAAGVLGISPRTVKREWQTARAWLQHRLVGRGETPA